MSGDRRGPTPNSRRQFLALLLGTAVLGSPQASAPRDSRSLRARVVVVGGGFAGSACALALRSLDPTLEVTLIDPVERYVTCPMSNSVLVGLRDLDSLSISRLGLRRAGVDFVPERATLIDSRRRRVFLEGGTTLPYDRLVMAAGIRFLWGQPEGYDEAASLVMPHGWQAGSQTERLAAQLRALRDGAVVAISVPRGPMRCPPGPFERASLIASYLAKRAPRSKVLIFDANNSFPKQDMFTDAWNRLYPGMIDWIPVLDGGAVLRVAPAEMALYTSTGRHRADLINVIPPQAPAHMAVDSGLASAHGWCPIDPRNFESTLAPQVHVIGDACIADPMPKAASSAFAQAWQCARAIIAALNEREIPEAELVSVCYSLLSPDQALAIHGRFRTSGGRIERRTDTPGTESGMGAEEFLEAQAWYADITRRSFGV